MNAQTMEARGRIRALEVALGVAQKRITELESKLDQTIQAVRELGLIMQVAQTWQREEMQPVMQRADYLEALTMRLKGASYEEIAMAKAFAELRSSLSARSEAETLMNELRQS